MKNRLGVLALVLLGFGAAPALAGGTPEDEAACKPDVRKFCHKVAADAGDMEFLSCLKQHRARLSSKCRHVLESNGQ